MSLDAAFQDALRPLREELADLRRRLEAAEANLTRPVFDAKQLQDELGFSQHDAYALLRAHGTLLNGRRRISAVELMRVYSRDDSALSGARTAMKSASATN